MNPSHIAWWPLFRTVFAIAAVVAGYSVANAAPPAIVIGLDADMSSASAQGGEAIRRGALIAIAEINESGGLLGGRKLELQVKDHHGVPARSTDNLNEFAADDRLAAVLGGVHSPAIIENQQLIHDKRLLILVPWAAATPVIDNGRQPSYVFRISARDQYVGAFLTAQALAAGHRRVGLLLERTAWGRSNEQAITEALAREGLAPAAVQWFHWGDADLTPAVLALEAAGADAILMAANAVEGAAAIKALAARPPSRRLPVYSHWGVSGGRFVELAGAALREVDLQVMQTYSFLDASGVRARAVLDRYRAMFGVERPEHIPAPVGVAHAYELVQVLALAIRQAGSIDREKVRTALENLPRHDGLIRSYRPVFTRDRHEGLSVADYRMARYRSDGVLVPVKAAIR